VDAIRALNHVGISVANLERSVRFYTELLDMHVVVQGEFSGKQYEAILRLPGVSGKVALLKAGNMQVELFEFSNPRPRLNDPDRPVCDLGISHFCIEVTDIQGVYERLKAGGVSFHCPPLEFFGTTKATYGRDPDGNVFELVQMPGASS
jgi:catechol 2,3-dioxygenase-like lactoylglutathione lyase family enzyme